MNDQSSRSHAGLKLVGETRRDKEGARAKLYLVDLAGSERGSLSGAQGETLVEAQNINLSLALLGDVLAALARKQDQVPYRNSKLTYLLKDSLGGNSKTLMITNLRASSEYSRQSLVSLTYATRARLVTNRSQVNVNHDCSLKTVAGEVELLNKR